MSAKENALVIEGLYKDFNLPEEKKSSLKEYVVHLGRQEYSKFHVLKDINFTVKRGEFFGILGRNGSGKSTLLKLIGGIYQPTKGKIHVNGTLTPFIELGIGFNPELTGRENVYMNGVILGLSRKEINKIYNEIVDFAELEKFMDQKLKNYSSGMQVRLAFSIAIRAHNDILLIDEVLAVGDVNFQEKCFQEFEKIKQSGKTVVFISHDLGAVQRFCDRAIIINEGIIIDEGAPDEVSLKYGNMMAEEQFSDNQQVAIGTGKIDIIKTELIVEGKIRKSIGETEKFMLRTHFRTKEKLKDVIFGISILNTTKTTIIGPNTKESKFDITELSGSGYIDAEFNINILSTGMYSVVVAIFSKDLLVTHSYIVDIISFKVTGKARHGATNIEPEWTIKNITR
jgi:ABC-2 type transport system ATP-binding protein